MCVFSTNRRNILVAGMVFLFTMATPTVDALSQRVRANYDPRNKFDIRIGGIWGASSASQLNERTRVSFGKEIDTDYQLDAEFGYFLSPRASVNIGFIYIQSKTLKPAGNYDFAHQPDYSIKVSMKTPYYLFRYFFPMTNVDYYVSFGQALCFGDMEYYYRIPNFHVYNSGDFYDAVGIGFLASSGGYYRIREYFAVGLELGYRYFSTGDLENYGGDRFWVPGEDMGMSLDFSGPYLSAGLSFRL